MIFYMFIKWSKNGWLRVESFIDLWFGEYKLNMQPVSHDLNSLKRLDTNFCWVYNILLKTK